VLLDEVEKASPSLLNVFLQAFDEGWLTDGRGKRVYLSDAVVIMTSNAGSEHFRKLQSPLGFRSNQMRIEEVQAEINRDLSRRFPPEFRNRIDQVVVFEPLTKDEVRQIALKYIEELTGTLKRWSKSVVVEPDALEKIVTDGYSLEYGARFLKRVIDDRIKLPLSQRWKEANSFRVAVRDGQIVLEIASPRLVTSSGPEAMAV
jgi:ATP-dependent Clp protease ATP-binding subunit ClpA